MKKLSLCMVMLLVGIGIAAAQTPAIESPTKGSASEWSVDSHLFAYQNGQKELPRTNSTNSHVFLEHPYWEAFNPNTGEWLESTIWPLYPDLSEEEKSYFQTDGFMRASPDGEILIYPSPDKYLTVANRTTREIFETYIDYPVENVLPIWWSEDGEGVAVEGSGDSPYVFDPIVYYLRLRNHLNLTQTEIYSVRWTGPMIVNQRRFTPLGLERILDVHEHQVLTMMSDVTNWGISAQGTDETEPYLVIWNPENPDASVIINAFISVHKAAFVPGNPKLILLVLLGDSDPSSSKPLGVYLYDTIKQETTFLTSFPGYEVNHIDTQFSPDGEWLAVPKERAYQFGFFRTRDLLALPPQFIATPFPTYTPVPTYTPTISPTPTATGVQTETLANVLMDNHCSEACYLGIAPGVTTQAELEQILTSHHITYTKDFIGQTQNLTAYKLSSVPFSPFIPKAVYVMVTLETVDLIQIILANVTVTDIVNWFGAPDVVADIGDRGSAFFYIDEGLIFTTQLNNSQVIGMVEITPPGRDARRIALYLEGITCTIFIENCSIPTATPNAPSSS